MNLDQAPEATDNVLTFHYTPSSSSSGNKVVVPRDVKWIQVLPSATEISNNNAFKYCLLELEGIQFGHGDDSSSGSEHTTSLLKRIGYAAFESLFEIAIPNTTVEFIGAWAFLGCKNLRFVQLTQGLKELGTGVFLGCPLTTIRLPNSMVKIGPLAFEQCSQLKQVELSSVLEEIPLKTFHLCSSLEHIAIPPSVKTIGSNAFNDCHILSQVQLSEGLHKIDSSAFCQCTSLGTIRIPSSVVEIGRFAFAQCSALQTVEFADGNLQVMRPDFVFARCRKLFHLALLPPYTLIERRFFSIPGHPLLNRRRGSCLRTRFDELPVHKLCYLQVHRPLSETLEAIQQLDEEAFASDKHFDVLGMTPFDPLLFEALMSKYPHSLWNHKDASKTTAMYHLVRNLAPESSAAMQYVVNSVLQDRISSLVGLNNEWWRTQAQDTCIMIHETSSASERIQLFDQIIQTFRLMEPKENLSNLELAVWKMKISKITPFATNGDDLEESNTSLLRRERCRISCGAEIVIPNVLSYMDERNTIELFGVSSINY